MSFGVPELASIQLALLTLDNALLERENVLVVGFHENSTCFYGNSDFNEPKEMAKLQKLNGMCFAGLAVLKTRVKQD